MKKKLQAVKQKMSLNVGQSLSQDDLKFITGGTALLDGSGTSSTSGTACCDSTCVCKQTPEVE
ncbi:hypothetical protein KHS38_15030 [Mucilaginibacter sp. Bleaf8]|uniref:hypothetical protein n=1 Tax=Mucilaginibacter sp. Bleaf8 TaxID=2834430 RepID=UPI001BD19152|nr:hypothetical protein [Mucilaginibacter sp. Bleaf8]MBS7565724.1 hypothetical protein [Mucilaginibacter sp. Bleaf8]